MSYVKTVWQDLPDRTTPITAARLNNGETQYDAAVHDLGLLVSQYGAVGDGIADDTVAIQEALSAARTLKASLTFERNKTYMVSGTLNPTGVNLVGFGATIKVVPGITMNFNLFQPSGAFSANDLTLDLNKANTTDPAANTQGCGIYLFASAGWSGLASLNRVRVINSHQVGIRAQTASTPTDPLTVPASTISITNCVVEGCKWGLWLSYLSGANVNGCRISGSAADGILDFLTRDSIYANNVVASSAGHAIVTQYSDGFVCVGNRTFGSAGGITVGGGSTTLREARNFAITGNVVSGSTLNGISIDTTKTGAATTVVDCFGTISGNTVRGNTIHGIYLHNSGHVAVTGNTAQGNGNAGLAMDSRYVAVDGNVFTGNAWGIKFQGNTGTYGNYAVGRNLTLLNTTAAYSFDTASSTDLTLNLQGAGTPAGVVPAPVGSTFHRTDGAAGTSFYVKESGGTGNTGWIAK